MKIKNVITLTVALISICVQANEIARIQQILEKPTRVPIDYYETKEITDIIDTKRLSGQTADILSIKKLITDHYNNLITQEDTQNASYDTLLTIQGTCAVTGILCTGGSFVSLSTSAYEALFGSLAGTLLSFTGCFLTNNAVKNKDCRMLRISEISKLRSILDLKDEVAALKSQLPAKSDQLIQ